MLVYDNDNMQRFSKKRAPRLSDFPKLKRARIDSAGSSSMPVDVRLNALNKDIERIELEIKKQAERFEIVRAEMLTGIVSHNGITAKSASDQLMGILAKLQQDYQRAVQESDRSVCHAFYISQLRVMQMRHREGRVGPQAR